MKNILIKYRLIFFIIVVVILKQMMVVGFPIFAYSTAGHDDRLMINMTDSLLRGEWLGAYSEMTLVKGAFFPVFLAISGFFGIPYSISVTGFYSFACIVFVFGIKGFFKKDGPLMIIFGVLMFSPVSYAVETFLRVYRNSLTAAQVLIIVGCMFAVYLNKEKKPLTLLFWSLGGGLSLISLWHTREDGIWIMPLVLMVIIITLIFIFVTEKIDFREKLKKGIIVLLPIILLVSSTWLISGINYANYGIFTTNELSNSHFTEAIKAMYAIKPAENIDNVSVPRSTVNQLYLLSPALNGIKDEFEISLERWSPYDQNVPVREVEDGWFFWSLREAVATSGYYENAQKANAFYEQLTTEIDQAFATGKLSQRATMPSALMSPWRDEYRQELPVTFFKTFKYIASYDEMEISILDSMDDGQNGIRLFERLTNNLAQYPGETTQSGDLLRVGILHKLIRVYQIIGLPLFIAALILYLLMTGLLIFQKIRVQFNLWDTWLILTGLLGSTAVLVVGVAYTEISAYDAISYWYLTGTYPLIIVFMLMSLFKAGEIGKDLFNEFRK
ncbi:MAG: hypothetical protein ACOH15_08115 [Acetobacterium sp.]